MIYFRRPAARPRGSRSRRPVAGWPDVAGSFRVRREANPVSPARGAPLPCTRWTRAWPATPGFSRTAVPTASSPAARPKMLPVPNRATPIGARAGHVNRLTAMGVVGARPMATGQFEQKSAHSTKIVVKLLTDSHKIAILVLWSLVMAPNTATATCSHGGYQHV